MRRFNLHESTADLRIKLQISKCYGEASFSPNANLAPGALIPVIVQNPRTHESYIHVMRWGIDIYNNYKFTHNARSETVTNTPTWSRLLSNGQKCIIITKGFYLWRNQEILDPVRKVTLRRKDPFFVSPRREIEGEFMFIAGLYESKRVRNAIKYSVVALTQSSEIDPKYIGYVERTPFFLRRRDFSKWMDPRVKPQTVLTQPIKIATNEFLRIGKWVDSPNQYTAENTVLQSPFQWELEHDAKLMGLDDDNFDFGAIEAEALRQNEANKKGEEYAVKRNWDQLSKRRVHCIERRNGMQSVDEHNGLKAVNTVNAVNVLKTVNRSQSEITNDGNQPDGVRPDVNGQNVMDCDVENASNDINAESDTELKREEYDGTESSEATVSMESTNGDGNNQKIPQIQNDSDCSPTMNGMNRMNGMRKLKRRLSQMEVIEEAVDRTCISVLTQPVAKRRKIGEEDGEEFNFSDTASDDGKITEKVPKRRHSCGAKDITKKDKMDENRRLSQPNTQ